MSKFKFILTTIFVLVIVVGVVVFAFLSSGGGKKSVRVTMWGTIDGRVMDAFVNQMKVVHQEDLNFDYVQKDATTFDQDLVEALAVGKGPDLVLLPQDEILRNQDKLYPIPFSTLPQRTFLDTFSDEGNLYLSNAGVVGVPLSIDPLIMYWNRDLVTGAGFAKPASTWNELFTQIPKLTVKDNSFNITTSAIAMGEWSNVRYAKDILSTIIMQYGNPIVTRGIRGDSVMYNSVLSSTINQSVPPAADALRFFTEFSNPAIDTYSWNRSLRDSQAAFLSGDLVYYLGYASELRLLQAKNPNLNFDIALVPQPTGSKKRTTFGKMQALAIVKRSPNVSDAFSLIKALTNAQAAKEFANISGFAPARRDLLAAAPNDQYSPIIYSSALFSDAWFDPDPTKTNDIFKQMNTAVTTGSLRPSEAVARASQALDLLLTGINQ